MSGSDGLYFRSVEATQNGDNLMDSLQLGRRNINSDNNKLAKKINAKIGD